MEEMPTDNESNLYSMLIRSLSQKDKLDELGSSNNSNHNNNNNKQSDMSKACDLLDPYRGD